MAPPNFSSPSPANVGSANVFATIFDWEDSLDGLPPAADDWPVILDQLPEAKAARAAAGIHEDDYTGSSSGVSAMATIPAATTTTSLTEGHGLVSW